MQKSKCLRNSTLYPLTCRPSNLSPKHVDSIKVLIAHIKPFLHSRVFIIRFQCPFIMSSHLTVVRPTTIHSIAICYNTHSYK